MKQHEYDVITALMKIIKEAVRYGYDISYDQVQCCRLANNLLGIANDPDTSRF